MDSYLNLLDGITANIEKAAFNGSLALTEPLINLLMLLAIISIASTWEMYFSPESWNWGNLFIKFIHVGFIGFLIRNWSMFLKIIKESAEQIGLVAGNADAMMTPTAVLTSGVANVFEVMESLWKNMPSFIGGEGSIFVTILGLAALGFALFGFAKIAFTIFCVNVEFLIIGTLSMVLLPFSMTKWTKSIADKTWGILLTSAVKIMVATFMICLLSNEISNLFSATEGLGNSKEIEKNLAEIIIGSISITFLAYLFGKIVEYAGAMTTGVSISSPDLVGSAGAIATNRATGFANRQIGNAYGRASSFVGGQVSSRVTSPAKTLARNWWSKYQKQGG